VKYLYGNIRIEEIDTLIGETVKVTVDRPLGSYHPEHKDMYYPINYGFVEGIMAPDGEEQDAYIIGVETPVKEFVGKVIAVIHRKDDVEEKWVVASEGSVFTREQIWEKVLFTEQYYDSEIEMCSQDK
jgi:inorganic pyrophosphatase